MHKPESPCIFCEIVAGRLPASFIYCDEICSAFMDIQPVNPGHVLVVPNHHAALIAELDEDIAAHLLLIGMRVAAAVRQCEIKCEGVNFFIADGQAAGQDVCHVHLHIIPRYHKDGFGLKFSPCYFIRPPRKELDRVAEMIKGRLG